MFSFLLLSAVLCVVFSAIFCFLFFVVIRGHLLSHAVFSGLLVRVPAVAFVAVLLFALIALTFYVREARI